ncbi:hypothetical protein B566_EDAN007148 [Ephemera danica]|nr:hypothetical protein B566_EDAN007148 [Ephemera danica]
MTDEENVVVSPIFRDSKDIPELSLSEYLLPKLRANLPLLGDKPWVVDLSWGTKVLFRDAEDLSFRLGSGLSRLGFKHRDVLLYVTWEMAQLFVVQLAVWRLGGAVRPWHQSDVVETYTRLLHDTNARFVLVDQDTASVIRKAILSLEWSVTMLSIGDVDGATSIDELLHDDGSAGYLISNVMSLRNGISAYFISKFEKEEFVDLLLTYMPSSTAMYQHFVAWFVRHPDLEDVNFSFLKKIETGAAIIDPVTIAKFKNRLPHVQLVLIVDPYTGQTLTRGEVGELKIKSPTLTLGYHQPGSNAPNRSSFDDDGWFCTGDLGFIDKEGHVVVMERLNFTYKCQAHIVSPSEIESVIQEHDAILSVGVVEIPQPEMDCLSRAFVVLRPGHHVSEEELQKHVADRLPEHKRLHGGVRFISALPINTAGKVHRPKLKKLALEESTKNNIIELMLDVE